MVRRTVSRATVADAAELAAVQIASWRAAFVGLLAASELEAMDLAELRASWEQRLVHATDRCPVSGTTLIIREGVRLIGYSWFYPTEDHDDDPLRVATIGSIYTLPETWGTGAGTTLMCAAVSALTKAGYDEASLRVLQENRRAQGFYRSRGWVQDKGLEQILSGDKVISKVRFRHGLGTP